MKRLELLVAMTVLASVSCKDPASDVATGGCASTDFVCQITSPPGTYWYGKVFTDTWAKVSLSAGGVGRISCSTPATSTPSTNIAWQQLSTNSILLGPNTCIPGSLVNIAGSVSRGFFLAGFNGATVNFTLASGAP